MNKLLFCASLITATLTFVPPTRAASTTGNDSGFFIGARAGQGQFTGDTDVRSTTSSIDLGYRWTLNGHNSLGFQVGYVHPEDVDYSYDYDQGRLKSHAYTLGATYHLTFGGRRSGSHWYFSARAGYMNWNQDDEGVVFNGYGSSYTAYASNTSGTGSYAGMGIGYDFNDHVGLGLNYDYYLADVTQDGYGNYSVNGLSVPSLHLEVRF